MVFVKLNNGTTQNLFHICEIKLEKTIEETEDGTVESNYIMYVPAKGSLNGYRETFNTEQEAIARFSELKSSLLASAN